METKSPCVCVDFTRETGRIKPLHGLNNGPIGFGSMLDISHRFRELRLTWVRLHDTNWPHPREMDVPQIFPDFNADPDDPASYCFGPTDDYLRSILDTGAKIVYRLGVSIEHYARKRFTTPPADPARWARIALNIARHYSEGWADGIKDAVEYWEIWNEPDLGAKMWDGTFDQYMELYRETALAFKRHNPALKVGGYAAAFPDGPHVAEFIAYCKSNRLPLDFFSWHTYAPKPGDFAAHAVSIRRLLDEYGFNDALSLLTEWNYLSLPWNLLCGKDEFVRRDGFERMKNEEGAAFAAATLILMQDAPIDMMNYYDGQALTWFCGLFDYYGVPQKTFHAFKAFTEFLDCPQRVPASSNVPGLAALAGRSDDGRSGAVLIANFGAHEGRISISIRGLKESDSLQETLLLDADHNLEPMRGGGAGLSAFVSDQNHIQVDAAAPSANPGSLDIMLRRHSVALIRVTSLP